jgi:hypothetical protein
VLKRVVIFILGVFLSAYSLMFFVIYLNLFKMGFTFFEYIKFIFTRLECLMIFLGIILIYLSLRKGNKNELYI